MSNQRIKYLRVTINSDGMTGEHINNTVNKASHNIKTSTKELAYMSLVRPTAEYISSAWDPY